MIKQLAGKTAKAMILRLIIIGLVFTLPNGPVYSSELESLMSNLGIKYVQKKIYAPDFTLPNLEGKKVSLRDYRGKVVFLNFMATWCHWCRKEMPHLQKLHDQFKDNGLVIVVVYTDLKGAESVIPFVKKNGYTFAISSGVLDPDGEVSRLYGVSATPSTFLLDRNGMIVGWGFGYRDWSSKNGRNIIKKLLESK